jgi:dipeptidyl aminopeptidase/acylaminoacyl peptidase
MPTLLTAEALWSLARVSPPVVARDGSFSVASVRRTDPNTQQNTTVLYRIARGHSPHALTARDASSTDAALSSDAKTLAFVRRPLGAPSDRAAQLHVMSLEHGGEPRVLGDFPLGVSEPRFFEDGRRMCVVANVYAAAPTLEGTRALREERAKSKVDAHVTEDRVFRFWDRWLSDGEVPHIFEVSLADGTVRDCTPNLTAWFDLMGECANYDIAPDGSELVFAAYMHQPQHQRVRSAIYRLSLSNGVIECLTPDHVGDDVRPCYAPDGSAIVYGARRDHVHCSHLELRLRSRVDGSERTLAPSFEHDVDEWSFADARTLVGSATIRGRTRPWTLSIADDTITVLETDGGSVRGVRASRDGTLWCTHDSLTRPPEVHTMPLAGGPLAARSHFNDELVESLALARVEERTMTGDDDEPVQVFVLHPHPSTRDESSHNTLVHLIHGGPFGIFGDAWSWRWNAQVFAARGHTVAMVNFQGSSSFGERFAKSILGDWGGKPARDILAVTDALVAEGLADTQHVAVAGASYGGYLTAWLTTQTQRFRCAIAHAPVTDVLSMMASDFMLEWDIEMGAWPWDGPEAQARFLRFDPMRHVGAVTTPTLVIHGATDYRVPYSQGLEWYGALKARGVPSRLVVYPGENHWILQRANAIHWFGEMLTWLDRWLRSP